MPSMLGFALLSMRSARRDDAGPEAPALPSVAPPREPRPPFAAAIAPIEPSGEAAGAAASCAPPPQPVTKEPAARTSGRKRDGLIVAESLSTRESPLHH